MGQNHSSTFSGRRKSLRRSLRSPFPRRSHTNHSLSATFNYLDPDVKGDQLNVNTATAEELMTLPGVTRTIAQNIVDYRQAIGRYNKVEDLALVTGVGAEKLSIIRPEICVHRRKTNSMIGNVDLGMRRTTAWWQYAIVTDTPDASYKYNIHGATKGAVCSVVRRVEIDC
ncbi:Endonuclease/exonuclease/phosphatase domain-containing protein 1 [Homalodisca vitripennis]|nr:Endonuclease/exonuclease/phosphatase domain-containing protein 1 [Homalodisca vitripennis]